MQAGAPEADPLRHSAVVQAVERTKPAVVNISTEEVVVQRGPAFGDPFFDQFFRDFVDPRPRRFTRSSLGSGVIVNANGTILTNHHVVQRASKITITLADEREFQAKVVGSDDDTDLAVVRIATAGGYPFIDLGHSDDLMIGETVIAIGNPFGLSNTVSTGVVSAIGRALRDEERTYTDFIQTDASINPGNSGGALLNIRGELIGINTAIYGKAQGIGFAIPVDRARRVLKDLVSFGEVKRGWLGLAVQGLTRELQEHFGSRHGVLVTDVEADSPAAQATVVRGDLITRINGRDVDSREEFDNLVGSLDIGARVAATVRREKDEREISMEVVPFPVGDAGQLSWRLLGMEVADGRGGVVVKRVRAGSASDEVGLEVGDRVLGMAGARVRSAADFNKRLTDLRNRRGVQLLIGRGEAQYSVALPFSGS